MLHSLVLGLGRAGAGLHLPVLDKARTAAPDLFHTGLPLACDRAAPQHPPPNGAIVVDGPTAAARRTDPARTVAHVCTPPDDRLDLLTELADLGFTKIIAEKPLTADEREHTRIAELRERRGLRIAVVAHWLESALTARLRGFITSGELGSLQMMSFRQDKPRFQRSATTSGHPTAFDVEIPHSLGVALDLAGPAEVVAARHTDMHLPGRRLPGMGGAELDLHHFGGTSTSIRSDLTSPVQRRSVELTFTDGRVIGHYPISENDDHAQLITPDSRVEIFRDDALTAFVVRTYRRFRDQPTGDTFTAHSEVLRLIAAAKHRSTEHPQQPFPERTVHEHVG